MFNSLRPRQDAHSFAYHFQIHFFKRNVWNSTKGAVDYKSRLVQAMAWCRADTKRLPESVVIEVNGAHMRLSGSLSWLLHRVSGRENVQYIPRNMHTVFALLCFVVVIHWLIFPYPSGLLHWHCGNLTIVLVPAKQSWWIWINTSCEFIMNDCITTTKQSTTKPCAYFLGYTVCMDTMLRKTVLLEHTKANFTPIAESGHFWTVRSGWVEGRVDHICKIPSGNTY